MKPTAAWKTGLIRFTAFVDNVVPAGAWKELTGKEPDTSTSDRRAGRAEEKGEYQNASLKFVSTDGRVDWVVTDSQIEADEETDFDLLRDFSAAIEVADEIVSKWLNGSHPGVTRIAFGAGLFRSAASQRDGYNQLGAQLPGIRLSGAEDLIYRINRPRTSKVIAGLKINRVSSWGVLVTHKANVAVEAEGIAVRAVQDAKYLCRLELDINTDPTSKGVMDQNSLHKVWSELVQLGKEISEKGDVE